MRRALPAEKITPSSTSRMCTIVHRLKCIDASNKTVAHVCFLEREKTTSAVACLGGREDDASFGRACLCGRADYAVDFDSYDAPGPLGSTENQLKCITASNNTAAYILFQKWVKTFF